MLIFLELNLALLFVHICEVIEKARSGSMLVGFIIDKTSVKDLSLGPATLDNSNIDISSSIEFTEWLGLAIFGHFE